MTELVVGTVGATSGGIVSVPIGHNITAHEQPSQAVYVRTDARRVYSAVGTTWTPMPDLAIELQPRCSNGFVILTWMLNFEVSENCIFNINENGQFVDTGWTNLPTYTGIAVAVYDQDQSSTLANICLRWVVPITNSKTKIYQPTFRLSNTGAAQTLTLNRTITSAGADSYETTFCSGLAIEVPVL